MRLPDGNVVETKMPKIVRLTPSKIECEKNIYDNYRRSDAPLAFKEFGTTEQMSQLTSARYYVTESGSGQQLLSVRDIVQVSKTNVIPKCQSYFLQRGGSHVTIRRQQPGATPTGTPRATVTLYRCTAQPSTSTVAASTAVNNGEAVVVEDDELELRTVSFVKNHPIALSYAYSSRRRARLRYQRRRVHCRDR